MVLLTRRSQRWQSLTQDRPLTVAAALTGGAMHSRTPLDQRPPAEARESSSSLLDRLSFGGFILAAVFLCFIGGGMVVLADVFPAQAMKDAYRGGKAFVEKMQMSESPLFSDYWKPERTSEKGVTVNEAEAYPGYTLYSRSEEHTSELQSLMRISYAVFCLKKKTHHTYS